MSITFLRSEAKKAEPKMYIACTNLAFWTEALLNLEHASLSQISVSHLWFITSVYSTLQSAKQKFFLQKLRISGMCNSRTNNLGGADRPESLIELESKTKTLFYSITSCFYTSKLLRLQSVKQVRDILLKQIWMQRRDTY